MHHLDRYYIATSKGPIKCENGDIFTFKSNEDARHFAYNYCDLSDNYLGVFIYRSPRVDREVLR